MTDSNLSLGLSHCDELDPLLQGYLQMWRQGAAPAIADFAKQHSQYSDELAELLPTMILTEQANNHEAPPLQLNPNFDHPTTLGVYELHREIGRGGMGVVYEATQTGLSQKFAVKVLANRALPSSTMHSRFVREAESSSRLHHSNIVPSKFYGSEGMYHYLVMPLIDGISLDRLVARFSGNDSQIQTLFDDICGDWRRVCRLGAQIASALQYSHENGIIHRDIKPANLLLDRKGNPWITDFGLAKLFEEDDDLSRTGELIGTPRYMSPEQVFGVPDARSDVYSLGLTLYEILAMQKSDVCPPLDRSDKRSSALEMVDLRCINPKIPESLSRVIMKACSHHPESRYQTARDFERDLNHVAHHGCQDRRSIEVSAQSAHNRYRRSSGMMVAVMLMCLMAFPVLSPWRAFTRHDDTPPGQRPRPSDFVPPPTYCLAFDEPGTDLINVLTYICSRTDDVEQYGEGAMYVDSSDLEFTWDEEVQVIGLRFPGVEIPRNAHIHSAKICFFARRSDQSPTELSIYGIDDTNPSTFCLTPYDVTNRKKTEQVVPWSPGPWTRDEQFETPSCVDIVQHLVNQQGWKPGNAIGFIVDGTGNRTAMSYDGNIHSSPFLHIQYERPIHLDGPQ
jgi:serine/threonine protein kinase